MPTNAWSNDSITTLTIPTGATSGARVVIDGTTGLISVYNAAGNLVGFWGGSTGQLNTYGSGGPTGFNQGKVILFDGTIIFDNTTFGPAGGDPSISGGFAPNVANLFLASGLANVGDGQSSLLLTNGVPAGTELLFGFQRGVGGGLLQNDSQFPTATPQNNLVHLDTYSIHTNGSGQFNQAHNCAFTPKGAIITQHAPGVGSSPVIPIVFDGAFTSTNFAGQVWLTNGSLLLNGTMLAYIEFFG